MQMNDVIKPGILALIVIVLLGGIMVPYVTLMGDNIVEKNDNPVGRYMMRDSTESSVTCEITSDGIMINDYKLEQFGAIILDTGMIRINSGRVSIYDLQNNTSTSSTSVGFKLIFENGTMNYKNANTDYTMTYTSILYPSKNGNYSAYGSNIGVNATNGESIFILSNASSGMPNFVTEYTDGIKTDYLAPFTVTDNVISDYTGSLVYDVPAAAAADGKSWRYEAGNNNDRTVTADGEPCNILTIAPNTYAQVGKMSMVIAMFDLMPLLLGIMLFSALGVYIYLNRN